MGYINRLNVWNRSLVDILSRFFDLLSKYFNRYRTTFSFILKKMLKHFNGITKNIPLLFRSILYFREQ